jgi:hypothetical protein
MRKVAVEFTLQYLECNLAPEFAERAPQVDAFLDGHFYKDPEGSGVVRVSLDDKSLSKVYNVKVEGQIHRRAGQLPNTASLALVSFAERVNDFNAPCLMDAGTNHIRLQEMSPGFTRDIALQIHTTQPLGRPGAPGMVEKGKLRFTVKSIDMGGLELVEGPMPVSDHLQVERVGNELMRYINGTIEFEKQMSDAIPGTDRIRAPFDISEHGMEMTGAIPLPVAAYARFETPSSNLAFWRNTFDRVMARDGRTKYDFNALDDTQKARVMSLICVYPSQWFDYISDTVERNTRHARYQERMKESYENFGDALFTYSGDCEDLAMGIQQVFSAFTQFKFPANEKELRELQQIASEYIPVLSLDVVHGAKVADENAPKGAHMNDNFIPIRYMRDAMRKTRRGAQIESRLPWDKPYEQYRDDLPVLVGEGTGMYEPLGYEDPLADARKYVYSAQSLAPFKKPILHSVGAASNFFLGSLMGITNYWFDRGCNVGALYYATQDRDNAPLKRGILFTDIVNESHKMAIVPHPPIPASVMGVINEATLLRVPPKPLMLHEDAMNVNTRNAYLDGIAAHVESMGRVNNGTADRAVPVYIRPHQLNEENVDAIKRELKAMHNVWKVSYEMENVVNHQVGYRVMFHVN